MTAVITDACIKCKLMDCVEVCPADAFYEGENMLVINPLECLDCGVCIEECPIDAILFEDDEGAEPWLALNAQYSKIWPNVTYKGTQTPPDANDFIGVAGKFEDHFSSTPGTGDVEKPPYRPRQKKCAHCKPTSNDSGLWRWLKALFR